VKLPEQPVRELSNRESRIQAILQEAMRGSPSEDAALQQQHAEMMPELGERLRTLRAIQTAAAKARFQQEHTTDPLELIWRENLTYLQDELPEYEILESVEYGGQGVVYKATQRATNRIVAIKVLLDGPLATERQRRRFAREVELCSRLNHPNIVTVYESGTVRGRNYCAMEFVEGLPIDDYVLLHAPSVRDTVRPFVNVCRAVSHAHQRGIIHRDLSPANILMDVNGDPHILDFGLAKDMWRDDAQHSNVSVAGQVVGTIPYMSPEQVGGLDGQVDVRSDIYTLGVVLFRLLAGALPYELRSRTGLQVQILTADPLPMQRTARQINPAGRWRDLSRDLEMIVAKALAKDKEQRYQSAAALAEDLERYLAGEAVSARANHTLYVLRKTVRRHRVAFGAAAVVLLTLGVSAAVTTGLWLEARAQRDRARQGFRVAHSMFDKVVTDIDESIRPLAGGTEVSDHLLNVVADELPALEALAASDQTLTDVVARLHDRQGDICRARREQQQAAAQYQTCLNIALEQAAAAPGQLEHMHDAARAHVKLAKVTDDPPKQYQQAIQIEQKLLEARPEATEFASTLAEARIEYSHYLWGRDEFGPALAQAEAALNLLQTQPVLVQTDPGQVLLALARERYSDAAISMGQQSAAVDALRECARVRERLSAARPVDVNRRYLLLRVYLRLGGVLSASHDGITEAREVLEKAARTGEYLLSVDPSMGDWRWDLNAVYARLLQICFDSNDLTGAERYLAKAMSLLSGMPEGQDKDPGWLSLRAYTYQNYGKLRIAQQRFEEAKPLLQRAIAIREAACAADPDDANSQSVLADAYDFMGRACRQLRQLEEALVWYEKSYDIRERLFRAKPDEVQRELNFILSKLKLATWHLTHDTPGEDAAGAVIVEDVQAALLALQERGVLHGRAARAYMDNVENNLCYVARHAVECAASVPCAAPDPTLP
jgi:tetratricopeptide (TPR) repeat protein/tRNA A-37 threonylcarbamoyl transferase component Bud32